MGGKTIRTLCCKVTAQAGYNAKDDAGPRINETGSRSSSNESRDGTRAPANHGPLLGKTEIKKAPSHGSKHGSEARVPASHNRTKVGTKGGATVESKPSEPEENGAKSDEGDVVWSEVHHHSFVSSTEDPGVGKGRETRSDFDRDASSVVENAVLEAPSVGVPNPECQGAIDQSCPEKSENHAGNNTTAFRNRSDREASSDSAEHHLVERVEKGGDESRANRRATEDLLQTKVSKIADEAVVGSCAESQREPPEIPLENNDTKRHHDDPEHRQGRLSSCQTRVEEGDARNHEEDETCANNDEGLVSGLKRCVKVMCCWRRRTN